MYMFCCTANERSVSRLTVGGDRTVGTSAQVNAHLTCRLGIETSSEIPKDRPHAGNYQQTGDPSGMIQILFSSLYILTRSSVCVTFLFYNK